MANIRPEIQRALQALETYCGPNIVNREEGTHRAPRLVVSEMCKYFQYPKLLKQMEKSGAFMEVEAFMSLAVGMNSRDTHGMYHEVMPFIHAYHNVPEMFGYPLYDHFADKAVLEQIRPRRVEYLDLYVIQQKIRQHEFLRAFPECLRMTYQVCIDTQTERYFDAAIEPLGVLIEINECRSNHEDHPNDLLKRSIAKGYGYHLLTFLDPGTTKEAEAARPRLLSSFAERTVETLTNALIAKGKTIEYSLYNFQKRLRKTMYDLIAQAAHSKLESEAKATRIKRLGEIIGAVDASRVQKILSMRSEKFIKSSSISELFLTSPSKTIQTMVSQGVAEFRDGVCGVTWEGLAQVLLTTTLVDASTRCVLWEYVLALGPIYEEMLERVRQYYDDRRALRPDIDRLLQHHFQKLVSRYSSMLDAAEERERKLLKDHDVIKEVEKKLVTHGRRIVQSLEKKVSLYRNKSEHASLHILQTEIEQFAAEREARVVPPQAWTLGFRHHQSMIHELEDFEVLYAGGLSGYSIRRDALERAFREVGAPPALLQQIYEQTRTPEKGSPTDVIEGMYLRGGPQDVYEDALLRAQQLEEDASSSSEDDASNSGAPREDPTPESTDDESEASESEKEFDL